MKLIHTDHQIIMKQNDNERTYRYAEGRQIINNNNNNNTINQINIQQNIINFDTPDLSHVIPRELLYILYKDYDNNLMNIYLDVMNYIFLKNKSNIDSIEYKNKNEIYIYRNNEKQMMNIYELANFMGLKGDQMIDEMYDKIFDDGKKYNVEELKHKYNAESDKGPIKNSIVHFKTNYDEYTDKSNEQMARRDADPSIRRRDSEKFINMVKQYKEELKYKEEFKKTIQL